MGNPVNGILRVGVAVPVVNETDCERMPGEPTENATPMGTCLTPEFPVNDRLTDPTTEDVAPAGRLVAAARVRVGLTELEETDATEALAVAACNRASVVS